jgi:hypothetical protein
MIRFRFGQAWKREGPARPVDSFALEVDGVDLLAGASEEPLDRIVPELIDGLCALVEGKVALTGVALPEAHLELLVRREGQSAALDVVSLARPARRVYGPVRVDLEDLAEAAAKCGRALLADLAAAGAPVPADVRRGLATRVERLARSRAPTDVGATPSPWVFTQRAQEPVGFGFNLEDPADLLRAFRPDAEKGALGTLLFAGSAFLSVRGETLWRASAPPFLLALELARQGQDLVHAVELEEARFRFTPGGAGRPLSLDLRTAKIDAQGKLYPVAAEALAAACFDLGQRLALAVRARAPAQAKNPWLEELVGRSREGLARLTRGVVAEPRTRPVRPARKRTARPRPLPTKGRIRRLRFDPRWEKSDLGVDEPGVLTLGRRGPLFVSPQLAAGFTLKGELLFRQGATHGLAASPDGYVVAASADRVVGMPGGRNAAWVRDHDGVSVGPELCRREGLLIAAAQGRGALAFHEVTGREIWRQLPPRTQRARLSVQGHRALLATDAGHLFGLDVADGQLRYRVRSPLPYLHAAVAWGRRALTVAGRGEHTLLSAVEVHGGKGVWTTELSVAAPCRPLVVAGRILLSGTRGEDGVLLCLSARGTLLWERPLHLGAGPFGLYAVGRSVVVGGPAGNALQLTLDGVPEWRVGAAGDPLHAPLPPRGARGVVILPGELTRAVDPRGGRVMAEVRTGPGLCGLQVDPRLNLYALDEDGSLTAWRLTTSLSVV